MLWVPKGMGFVYLLEFPAYFGGVSQASPGSAAESLFLCGFLVVGRVWWLMLVCSV